MSPSIVTTVLVEISGPTRPLVEGLARSTEHPVAFSFLTKTAELIGGAATDFDVIRAAGVPGYSFAYMRGSSIYHTDQDVPENLNVDGLVNQASLALGIARTFRPLEADSAEGETVFFTIPTGEVVRYGSAVAGASGAAAAALLGLVLWMRIRRGGSSIRKLIGGFGLVALGSTLSAMALTLVWIGLSALREGVGLLETYAWMLALAVGVIGIWSLIWLRSRVSGSDVVGGVALVWALLALTTGVCIPSMSYLFVWPAIAAALGRVVARRNPSSNGRLFHLVVVALVTAIVLIPALDILAQLVTPRPGNPDSELSTAVAVPLILFMLAVGLVHSAVTFSPALDPNRKVP